MVYKKRVLKLDPKNKPVSDASTKPRSELRWTRRQFKINAVCTYNGMYNSVLSEVSAICIASDAILVAVNCQKQKKL